MDVVHFRKEGSLNAIPDQFVTAIWKVVPFSEWRNSLCTPDTVIQQSMTSQVIVD